MNSLHTPGLVAWQKFGNAYCLTGQYGMRPIILACGRKGLTLRDQERDLLIPFDPNHQDAIHIETSFNYYDALNRVAECAANIFTDNPGERIAGQLGLKKALEELAAIRRR